MADMETPARLLPLEVASSSHAGAFRSSSRTRHAVVYACLAALACSSMLLARCTLNRISDVADVHAILGDTCDAASRMLSKANTLASAPPRAPSSASPPPPPPTPALSQAPSHIAARINRRFRDAEPSSDPHTIGVAVHGMDGFETNGIPWHACMEWSACKDAGYKVSTGRRESVSIMYRDVLYIRRGAFIVSFSCWGHLFPIVAETQQLPRCWGAYPNIWRRARSCDRPRGD